MDLWVLVYGCIDAWLAGWMEQFIDALMNAKRDSCK